MPLKSMSFVAAFFVVTMLYAAPSKLVEGWSKLVVLAESATKCDQKHRKDHEDTIDRSCFYQVTDKHEELNISHKLNLSGPVTTLKDGKKRWDKDELTLIYARVSPSESTVWFFAYDLAGRLVKTYKVRTPFVGNGKELPDEELKMDPGEAESIATQELRYWSGWKHETGSKASVRVK